MRLFGTISPDLELTIWVRTQLAQFTGGQQSGAQSGQIDTIDFRILLELRSVLIVLAQNF